MDNKHRHIDALLTSLKSTLHTQQFSDITIEAFNTTFHLHRIILISNPYFRAVLEGAWIESHQRAWQLQFDDPNITLPAFKILIARIYGSFQYAELTEECVMQVLATASFFNDDALCLSCQEFIQTNLNPRTLPHYLTFAHTSHYGPACDGIIDACLLYLSKHISTFVFDFKIMPLYWLANVLSSDCLFVAGEQARWDIFGRVLEAWQTPSYKDWEKDRRMSLCASDDTLVGKEEVEGGNDEFGPADLATARNEFVICKYTAALELHSGDSGTEVKASPPLRELIQQHMLSCPCAILGLSYDIPKDEYSPEIPTAPKACDDTRARSLLLIKTPSPWNSLPHPPFRFGYEFPVAQLEQARKHRGTNVYSTQSFFHAGSMWLLYVKVSTATGTLGIFLQRMPPKMDVAGQEPNDGVWVDLRTEAKHRSLETVQSFKQPGCWGWPAYFSQENAFSSSCAAGTTGIPIKDGIKCAVVVGLL
ncbi:hypothetical protein HDU98_004851 [Podochytrium sp. JEL0797]|nr:hypothetical protein HDU98_004851 [Podochytrium sp. JEL0797]